MNFKKTLHKDYIAFHSESSVVIFGFEALAEEKLLSTFPNLKFLKLHQVHSDILVPASDQLKEADAHFTKEPFTAPLIQTADCLPVMIVSDTLALSIHAGWRGVEQNIIGKSLLHLKEMGESFESATAFIGPHIQKSSFEVEREVGDRLLQSHVKAGGQSKGICLHHPDHKKVYVDLSLIAQQQLCPHFSKDDIITIPIDTFSDVRFHSYRRNNTKGRQWSFCFLKK